MAQVTFVFADWIARYPEFALTPPLLAQDYFNEATLYCSNADQAVVQDLTVRTMFLYMITAHIAQLYAPNADGSQQSQLVGRISNATQGSVSVGTDMPNQSEMAAWFNQTKYGASYWRASARFRTFRPIPGPQPFFEFGRNFGIGRFGRF